MLTKWPYTVFFAKASVGNILFTPLPYHANAPRDEISKSWQAFYWTYHNGIISGPLEIGSGEKEALCMKLSVKGVPEQVSADCIMFQPRLAASFSGEKKDVDTFLQIIRDMN